MVTNLGSWSIRWYRSARLIIMKFEWLMLSYRTHLYRRQIVWLNGCHNLNSLCVNANEKLSRLSLEFVSNCSRWLKISVSQLNVRMLCEIITKCEEAHWAVIWECMLCARAEMRIEAIFVKSETKQEKWLFLPRECLKTQKIPDYNHHGISDIVCSLLKKIDLIHKC